MLPATAVVVAGPSNRTTMFASGGNSTSQGGGQQPNPTPSAPAATRNPAVGKFALVVYRAGAAIAAGLTVAGALPVISAFQYLLAASGFVLLVAEVVDIGRQPHRGVASQRAHVLRCLAWLVIAATGSLLAPSLTAILVFAAVYGLCTLMARDAPAGTTVSPPPRRRVVVLAKWVEALLGDWRENSITLAKPLTSFVFVLACAGAAVGGLAQATRGEHNGGTRHESLIQRRHQHAAMLATTGLDGHSIAADIWKGECPTPPGTGAPLWASTAIAALFTGASTERTGNPPGTAIAGCTGKPHEVVTSTGLFVWMLGENLANGRTLSLAVDSHQFGPALFLWPAVTDVIKLIDRYGAVGGVRGMQAGDGNLYPVETDNGTYILIRRETGTEQVPQPYIALPPTVATAWADAMRQQGSWLWPLAPQSISGSEVFRFGAPSNPSHVVCTILYDRKNGAARLDNHPIYHLPELELSAPELERDAQSAR